MTIQQLSRNLIAIAFLIAACYDALAQAPSPRSSNATHTTASNLRCEYLVNPLGIDVEAPRLSWELKSESHNVRQTAYQILVAHTAESLASDQADLWDSGKVPSDQQFHIEYKGLPLTSCMACFWKVRVWDQHDRASTWSGVANWSMGLLQRSHWTPAVFIAGEAIGDMPPVANTPATLLRKAFTITKPARRATLHATGLGLYELYLNGHRVGNELLAPEFTKYDQRLQYRTYDVTSTIAVGENAIGVVLGDGWHGDRTWGAPPLDSRKYRGQRGFMMRLDIESVDGSYSLVTTDTSWRSTSKSGIQSAGIYDGQTTDARLVPQGWNRPNFDDAEWNTVTPVDFPGTTLVSQPNEPLRVTRELATRKLTEPSPSVFVFDLGQNMVGWCRFTPRGCAAGQEISLLHGERLNPDGTVYMGNLRSAQQRDVYVCHGRGEETFEPSFTYHGFRYVEVRGLRTSPQPTDTVGLAVNSSAREVGQFECSNTLVNQLMHNAFWSQLGNLTSVPTDCPQRDERAGWMGDIQAFSQTAIFNMDMAAFFTKWLADVRDSQADDGRFADFSPHPGDPNQSFSGAPAWGDAGVFVPWRMYVNYGDTRILEQQIGAARRWIDFIHQKNPDLLWTQQRGNDYGDWLNGDTLLVEGLPREGNEVPKDLFATAFWYQSTRLLSRMYNVLGQTDEGAEYGRLADGIRAAFHRHYVADDGRILGDTQAGYALALRFDLLSEPQASQAASHLLEAIDRYQGHLSTGIQTTHRAMLELSRRGHHDTACRLINLRTVPSWGYTIDMGATTIWERWDGYVAGRGFQNPGMNSFNHWALGAVAEWAWRNIAGLNPDDAHPGWKHFTVAPRPSESFTWARAQYHSIRGRIATDWRIVDDQLMLEVEVPPNSTATIRLPSTNPESTTESGEPAAERNDLHQSGVERDTVLYEVGSGYYRFATVYSRPHASVRSQGD
jgi:alpha-L-rhamnosidase